MQTPGKMFKSKILFNFYQIALANSTIVHSSRLSTASTASSTSTSKTNEVTVEFLEKQEGKIAVIGFNRGYARNAMSKTLLNRLQEIVREIRHDSEVRVAIVRSLVPGIFCAGADLKERAEMTNAQVWHHTVKQRIIVSELENLPMPVIAAIDGPALGGGLEIALGCDLRVASDSAKMGLVETMRGLLPGAGGSQRLPRVVGLSKAKELMLTARIISGREAAKIGLVNRCVDQNTSGTAGFESAMELAEEILPNGPVAVRVAKFAINHGLQVDVSNGMAFEEACYAQVINTKDRIEGLLAFKEKQPPRYTGQ